MKQKACCFFVAVLLVATTAAARAAQFGDFTYQQVGPTIEITKYTGAGDDVTIPNAIDGLPVTRIGWGAFSDCTGLTSVTIPNSVFIIENGAFQGCTNLANVTIGNSVTSIGSEAFGGCHGLTNITMPDSVTTIGDGAFEYCTSLTSITIPNSVNRIGGGAFNGCSSLTSITIPDGVTSVEVGVFAGCTSLNSVTIPNSVTRIGTDVIVSRGAFEDCTSLTSITIPDSVTSIGIYTFRGCTSLTSVTIPNSVTNIGPGVFDRCTSLIAITVDSLNPSYRSAEGVLFDKTQTALSSYRHRLNGRCGFREEGSVMISIIVIAATVTANAGEYVTGPVEVVAEGLQFSEGPVWLPGGELVFSDIPADSILRVDKTVFRKPSGKSNGLTLDPQGRLIACEHLNRRVTRTEPDGKTTVLADAYQGKKLNSPNDVVVRSDGAVFFTDPPYGLEGGKKELAFQGMFAITAKGEIKLIADDFKTPNGIALSPDEKTLYVADTEGNHVRAFNLAADRSVSHGRVFCEVPGPDGMKIDTKGQVWCTAGDGVRVYSPDGGLVYTVKTPQVPANCAFGDADSKTLYITARTGLYKVRVATPGIRPGPKAK